jgi:hypothetical protein
VQITLHLAINKQIGARQNGETESGNDAFFSRNAILNIRFGHGEHGSREVYEVGLVRLECTVFYENNLHRFRSE